MVLEVNNTFGEKHLYILHSDNPANPPARKGYTFAGEMEKTFHISPFNHRSGNYNIQVRDPLDSFSSEGSRVDMHMVVLARDGTKSMVARAFSVSPSFDMITGNTWKGLGIVITWGYNTFLAVPETMYEAWKLYRKKAVVYTRPEVLVGSGQRDATKAERFVNFYLINCIVLQVSYLHQSGANSGRINCSEMQKLWLDYFKRRVETYSDPISVTLTLPESKATKIPEVMRFQSSPESLSEFQNLSSYQKTSPTSESTTSSTPVHLTIRVSNPRFFARFFSHQDPQHTIYLDIISQPVERRLAQINDLQLFQNLLSPKQPNKLSSSGWRGWRWQITAWLRRRKTAAELDALPAEDTPTPTVHAPSSLSTLDEHFLTSDTKRLYRRAAVQAVLIDTIAFGEAESLELYEKIVGLALQSCLVALTMHLAASFKAPGSIFASIRTIDCLGSVNSLQNMGTFALVNSPLFWSAARAVI